MMVQLDLDCMKAMSQDMAQVSEEILESVLFVLLMELLDCMQATSRGKEQALEEIRESFDNLLDFDSCKLGLESQKEAPEDTAAYTKYY